MTPDIPGYRILGFLGGGGIADVFHAEPLGQGAPVALKLLREPGRSRTNERRFLREGYLLRRLEHEGLPRCLDVLSQPPCLVLELLSGCTLAERIADEGRLSAKEATRVATILLKVLAYLHQHGVVHRDVKSSNIFVHNDGRILLMDLGLAIDPGDPYTTTLGDVLGTYAYMAPEQIAGAAVDQRSDLYSLGITLYEALSGVRPFKARGTVGYLRAHKKGQATPLAEMVPDAPPQLIEVVHHLMARDPSGRPPSAGVALAFLTGRGGLHHELKSPPLVGRWAALGAIHGAMDAGGCVHIVGEVGSGVGRMANVAYDLARKDGVETLAVRCRRAGAHRSLLVQVARGLSLVMNEDVASNEAEVRAGLEVMGSEGGFLLLLEDLHLAESETLRALVRTMEGVKGLSVVTTSLFVPEVSFGRVVHLRPLFREEVAELVAGILGTSSPPGDLVGILFRQSGGLPALIVLSIRELHARGALRCEGRGDHGEPTWSLDPMLSRLSSVGVRPSLRWVLAELDPPGRRVLDVLAVAGERLPLSVLVQAAQVDPSGIDVGLLLKTGLVAQELDPAAEWFYIRRPLVAAVVEEEMGAGRRTEIHRALAQALTSFEPSAWRDDLLALHQALGSEPGEAAEPLLALAERAFQLGEHRRALDFLSHFASLPTQEPILDAQSALLRGDALLVAGSWGEAQNAYTAGRKLAEELHESDLVARAMLGSARAFREAGDALRCEATVDQLLAVLPSDRGHLPLRVGSQILKAQCLWWNGHEQVSNSLLRKAEISAQEAELEAAALEIMIQVAEMHAAMGRLEASRRSLKRALVQARRLPVCALICRTLFQMAMVDAWSGAFDSALGYCNEGEMMGRLLEQPYMEALCGVARAYVHMAGGDPEGAREILRGNRIAGDPRSDARTRLAYRMVQGELRLENNDHQSALAAFDQAAEVARMMNYAAATAFCNGMASVMTADAGALGESIEVLGQGGHHRWMAVLLMAGAHVVGDAATLAAAVQECRESCDLPMLVRGLHVLGGEQAREEASAIAERLLAGASEPLLNSLTSLPAVQWALHK